MCAKVPHSLSFGTASCHMAFVSRSISGLRAALAHHVAHHKGEAAQRVRHHMLGAGDDANLLLSIAGAEPEPDAAKVIETRMASADFKGVVDLCMQSKFSGMRWETHRLLQVHLHQARDRRPPWLPQVGVCRGAQARRERQSHSASLQDARPH